MTATAHSSPVLRYLCTLWRFQYNSYLFHHHVFRLQSFRCYLIFLQAYVIKFSLANFVFFPTSCTLSLQPLYTHILQLLTFLNPCVAIRTHEFTAQESKNKTPPPGTLDSRRHSMRHMPWCGCPAGEDWTMLTFVLLQLLARVEQSNQQLPTV